MYKLYNSYRYIHKTNLVIVFTMLSTSSTDGGLNDAVLNARLIGSNNLDKDLERYAVSKLDNVSLRAFSELKIQKEHITKSSYNYPKSNYLLKL